MIGPDSNHCTYIESHQFMNKSVLFDSNTWRHVASPFKYPNDKNHSVYVALNEQIAKKKINAYISETTIAIEQVQRKDRLNWIKTSTQYFRHVDLPGVPSVIGYAIGLLPSLEIEPVAMNVVINHLADASAIGMKVLKVDRAAYPESSLLAELPNSPITVEMPQDETMMRQLFLELESYGRGLANLKQLGMRHTNDAVGIHWSDGIAALDESYTDEVAALFGEWADGDAVAASIAHKINVFCTLDKAKGATSAKINSVLAPDFRSKLTEVTGLQFMTPTELLASLGATSADSAN